MTSWFHLGPRSEPRLPHLWNGVDSCGARHGGKDGAGFCNAKNQTDCWLLCPGAAWSPPLPSCCSHLPSGAISAPLCSPLQRTEMRLPCTWLRTQPAPAPRAGCLLGDEDLVWRTPEPPTQVQVVLGCPACYPRASPFLVRTLKHVPAPGVCQLDHGWGRLRISHDGGDMAGKEPCVQILARSRLPTATNGLAPRGGESGVRADSLTSHTCTGAHSSLHTCTLRHTCGQEPRQAGRVSWTLTCKHRWAHPGALSATRLPTEMQIDLSSLDTPNCVHTFKDTRSIQ